MGGIALLDNIRYTLCLGETEERNRMIILTVFTPTYNRAYRLSLCYDALLRQTNKEFKCVIVDDGSKDNTKADVDAWNKEGKIENQYIYQERQGVVVAHENALYNI